MCEEEEHSVTNTIKLVERETKTPDPIEDMEKYIHTVLDSDDEEAKKCKLEHNTALAMNTQVHIIHDNLKNLSDLDKGNKKETEKNYDPKSKAIFKEVWDLSDTSEDESIVKNLEKDLAKLNIETNQDSDNSETSAETVIKHKKKEISPEIEKCEKLPESNASLSPILRGEESSIVHSLGMVSKTKLDSATGTEDSKSFPQTSSRKYKYGT